MFLKKTAVKMRCAVVLPMPLLLNVPNEVTNIKYAT